MATLTLDRIWVNLLSTGAAVAAMSVPGRAESYEIAGEVRTYASGRRRSIVSPGEKGVYTFTLRLVTRTNVDLLRSWAGQVVQVRDNKGRKLYGVFYSLDVAEHVSDTTWDVTIALTVVTAAEGV